MSPAKKDAQAAVLETQRQHKCSARDVVQETALNLPPGQSGFSKQGQGQAWKSQAEMNAANPPSQTIQSVYLHIAEADEKQFHE